MCREVPDFIFLIVVLGFNFVQVNNRVVLKFKIFVFLSASVDVWGALWGMGIVHQAIVFSYMMW